MDIIHSIYKLKSLIKTKEKMKEARNRSLMEKNEQAWSYGQGEHKKMQEEKYS